MSDKISVELSEEETKQVLVNKLKNCSNEELSRILKLVKTEIDCRIAYIEENWEKYWEKEKELRKE